MLVFLVIYKIQSTASDTNSAEFWTAVFTGSLTVATIALWWIGYAQLQGIKKTSKADFIFKFTSEFFNPKNQIFILLCDNFALELKDKKIEYNNQIKSDKFPYFEVNQEIIKQLPLDQTKSDLIRQSYSCYEIDDFLGYFEDIGKFEKQGIISIENVYNSFSWYIETILYNNTIKQYLKLQKKGGSDLFENFNYISKKCKSFEKTLVKNKSICLFKFRWWLSNIILER